MLSSQVIQNVILGLKEIIKYDIDVLSISCTVVASTKKENIGLQISDLKNFINSNAEIQTEKGYQFFKVQDSTVEFVVRIDGDDRDAFTYGKLCAFQIQGLLGAYKEKYDEGNFIKNLLLDNLLAIDIYTRSKKLKIENDVRRVVFLIEGSHNKNTNSFEILSYLYPDNTKDFITSVDEENIVLVKELKTEDYEEETQKIAKNIVASFNTELMENVHIAVGSSITDLKKVSSSYKEAKLAMEVGKIFGENKNIINYDELGIGRLICQLPLPLCNMFVNEVLKGVEIKKIDKEMITTINKLFENNLNVSETSRQLYIHRNTLVYRLDKLQKITGLDLRNFDDSIIFKMTLMVTRYMEFRKKFPY